MRWPWRRQIRPISDEQAGRTAASPRGVWADLGNGRVELTPAFDHFEDDVAVWSVTIPSFPQVMGAQMIPPRCAIEWHFKDSNLGPWRHPDGKD